MQITLSPELEKALKERVEGGRFESVEALVEEALEWFLGMDDEELEETKAAIAEALAQCERGETRPAEEVFNEIRAKHGLSR